MASGIFLKQCSQGRKPLADVFAPQDEIVTNVVVALEPKIYSAERDRIAQKSPDRLDAWDHVIRALTRIWQYTRIGNETALSHLSEALRLDPAYAPALGSTLGSVFGMFSKAGEWAA